MPAKTERQRRAAGMALSIKRGKAKRKGRKGGAVAKMMAMSEEELRKMASKHGKRKKRKRGY